jgi:hypothetical protein
MRTALPLPCLPLADFASIAALHELEPLYVTCRWLLELRRSACLRCAALYELVGVHAAAELSACQKALVCCMCRCSGARLTPALRPA